MSTPQQFLTILFADIAGSTSLYQTVGDVEAHRFISDSLQSMRTDIENTSGIVLRTVGDAVLASFDRAGDAFQAAVAIQRSHVSLGVSVRVGFHCGEVIPDAGDIYGNAVNIAARVASYANANEIFTTEASVAHLNASLLSQAYYLDRVNFKGVSQPLAVFRINWADDSAETTEIITAVSQTQRYRTNLVLDLSIGAKTVRVDPMNPVLKLGRSVDNDIVVDHTSTSRNHAQVEFLNGRYVLADSSTNGSYVVRSGRTPEYIRRDNSILEDFGSITLGWRPSVVDAPVIKFKVTKTN